MIRPSYDVLAALEIRHSPEYSKIADVYWQLCRDFGNTSYTDLVLVPHLIRGGADLAAINLIKSLDRQGRHVLAFSTASIDSPWKSMLEKCNNVTFLELHKLAPGCSEDNKRRLLLRIVQNWQVANFTIINSLIGYDLMRSFGNLVKDHCKTFLHTYAFDMSIDGYIFNMIPNGLIETYAQVDLFVTDSKGYKQQLIEINGFSDSKVSDLYLPVESNITPRIKTKPLKKVLWASRVSSAKLVEVAIEIGEALGNHGIELHFYGALDHEYQEGGFFTSMIEPFKTIHYHGSYEGFESIEHEEYDMFLLTSKNEGLPNVILETVMANMFTVAPAVGGIPEVISDGLNGFLVEHNFTADEYIEKILDYYSRFAKLETDKKAQYNRQIIARHSTAAYDERVKRLYSI